MDATHLSALTISTEETSKADECFICFAEFHGRDVASVKRNPKCQTHCGHLFHLDCLTRQFHYQPIGLRSCGYCRQNPFPVLNMKTGESYPNTFFPDEAFYNAFLRGDLDQVKKSLAGGVYVDAVMKGDFNPLLMASAQGYTDLAEVLINNGADINTAIAEDGVTPLFMAAQESYTDIVKLLIIKGAKLDPPRTTDGATPLSIAVRLGSTDSVKLLLIAGANPNALLTRGMTPLYVAAQQGKTDCMKLLLIAGADINARTESDITPLFAAAERGNTECVKILINAGANINVARTSDGATPLSVATSKGHTDCVKTLTEAEGRRGTDLKCVII
ncbi:ankyrin repeat domain-containing protein [Endozoicomonas sp. ISHI1]|uniref:ankyrin repeat domain-containing protein n=1 Tax=Endozoicomonas sp. ISHI1 TaxID=2825882 RepID=UPI002149358C|nr:ankyrin repeat domain-containing protein [Endozoicomonas sp. ISHI1]